MKMEAVIKNVKTFTAVAVLALAFTACSSGGGGAEDKFQAAFTKVNPSWKVYEVKQEGENTIIRVEASDVVPFGEAKKALDSLQATDPKLKGYVEFYNKEVGMVLRKLEIVPAT